MQALPALAISKTEVIALAERGWKYEYRGSFRRQVASLPPSHLLAKTMPARGVCLLGDDPHPLTRQTLMGFRALIGSMFDEVGGLKTKARTVADCPPQSSVFIRLYSRRLPDAAFNQDLQDLNQKFEIGMTNQAQTILSPAQAVTFFGKAGQVTHIIMLQPHRPKLSPLQERFYRSIFIEELYQTYSFGIDVFKATRGGPYSSKLQESFTNLQGLRWTSKRYMEGLLSSNPAGLCQFDALMLQAILQVPNAAASSGQFIAFIKTRFEHLSAAAQNTIATPGMAALFDDTCLTIDVDQSTSLQR